jgi:hypothetical protein
MSKSWRRRAIAALAAGSFLALMVSGGARAACYSVEQRLSPATIAGFLGNPSQLLSLYPHGGAQLISKIRDLLASDPATLAVVVDLSAKGGGDQINSIGTALGQAALVCSRRDQLFANEIQQMVAASNNQPLIIAFTEVMGDQQLAATEPGVGAGGGGGGAADQSGSFAGSFVGAPLTATHNTPTNFFTLNSNPSFDVTNPISPTDPRPSVIPTSVSPSH